MSTEQLQRKAMRCAESNGNKQVGPYNHLNLPSLTNKPLSLRFIDKEFDFVHFVLMSRAL